MKRLAALLLLLVLWPLPASAADYPARVVGITDGDTLTVLAAVLMMAALGERA